MSVQLTDVVGFFGDTFFGEKVLPRIDFDCWFSTSRKGTKMSFGPSRAYTGGFKKHL